MQEILVLCDDIWHPAEVIEKGMLPLAGERYHFEFVKDAKDILTPGHILSVWQNKEFQKILSNAIQGCLEGEETDV